MDMATEVSALTELVVALERATLMAKQIPTTTDPSQIMQIYATLHSTHFHLSYFLCQTSQPPPQPSLPLPPPPPAAAENSSAADEMMQFGDDDEAEQTSKTKIDGVEERMKDCFIQSKRTKRPLSPAAAAAAEKRRLCENEVGTAEFDPQGTRLRALDLIHQFHC